MAWSVEATIGPLLIFVYIAFTLFGIYIAQFYYYYTTYRNDKRHLRLYVWAMGVLETTHTIFCIIFLYWYLVANFGDADNGVDRIHWALRASVMLEIVMVLMAQALYCWRIVQTSSGVVRVVATAIPGFLSFARFCLGLVSFILWVPVDRWDVMLDDPGDKRVRLFHGTLTATFAVELATDAAISVLLSWCLWNKGRHTVFSAHTNDTVQKFVHIIMHTATANIISTIAVIITFNIMSGTPVFVAIVEMRSKLYANVMMSLLNARKIPVERKRELSPLKWARPPTMHVHIYADNDLRDARNTRGRQTLEDIKEESVTGKNPVLQ